MSMTPEQLEQLQQQQQAIAASQADTKPIVTFKAGLLNLHNNTLTADQRRGTIALYNDDGVYRFEWSLRPQNTQQLSLTLIPGSAEFRLINSGTDARVCMLKLHDTNERHFFWMQETDSTNDMVLAKTVNDALTGQLQQQASLLQGNNNNAVTQQQFLSMLQNAAATGTNASSTTTAASAAVPQTPATSTQARAASDATPAPAASSAPSAAASNSLLARLQAAAAQMSQQQQSYSQDTQPTLNDIFDTDRILPIILADTELQHLLLQYLPESQRTLDDLKLQLRSPQFQATLSRLSSILRSEHYGQALQSMSLDPNTKDFGVLGFVEAIQKTNPPANSNTNNESSDQANKSNNT